MGGIHHTETFAHTYLTLKKLTGHDTSDIGYFSGVMTAPGWVIAVPSTGRNVHPPPTAFTPASSGVTLTSQWRATRECLFRRRPMRRRVSARPLRVRGPARPSRSFHGSAPDVRWIDPQFSVPGRCGPRNGSAGSPRGRACHPPPPARRSPCRPRCRRRGRGDGKGPPPPSKTPGLSLDITRQRYPFSRSQARLAPSAMPRSMPRSHENLRQGRRVVLGLPAQPHRDRRRTRCVGAGGPGPAARPGLTLPGGRTRERATELDENPGKLLLFPLDA